MEVTQTDVALLPPGDFDKLDKRQREAFHAMQERMIQFLIQESNHFQQQFADLHIEFRFQADVYQSPQSKTSSVSYSSRVY
jgi:hypothetical protein